MTKLLAITLCAAALAACSNMPDRRPAPNAGSADTQHSTDRAAARNGNGAAVSPGSGSGSGQ